MHDPSSWECLWCLRKPSRPKSVLRLIHFLLLCNWWTEFDETWQETSTQRPLPRLCFSFRSGNKDYCSGFWLAEIISTSPLQLLNEFWWNLTGSKYSASSVYLVFLESIAKQSRPPWSLISWGIFDFSSADVERNLTKLDMKQVLNILYQVCVFRLIANLMVAVASDWLWQFRLPLQPLKGTWPNVTGCKYSFLCAI